MKSSAAHMRRRIQSPRAQTLAPELRQLASALWQARPTRESHAQCHASLDAYTNAELAGRLDAWTHSPIHQHLLICARCATRYANLLQRKLNARNSENTYAPV